MKENDLFAVGTLFKPKTKKIGTGFKLEKCKQLTRNYVGNHLIRASTYSLWPTKPSPTHRTKKMSGLRSTFSRPRNNTECLKCHKFVFIFGYHLVPV